LTLRGFCPRPRHLEGWESAKGPPPPVRVRVGPAILICLLACPEELCFPARCMQDAAHCTCDGTLGYLSHHTSQFLGWLTVFFSTAGSLFPLPSRPAGEIQGRGKKATEGGLHSCFTGRTSNQHPCLLVTVELSRPSSISLFFSPPSPRFVRSTPFPKEKQTCCWAAWCRIPHPMTRDCRGHDAIVVLAHPLAQQWPRHLRGLRLDRSKGNPNSHSPCRRSFLLYLADDRIKAQPSRAIGTKLNRTSMEAAWQPQAAQSRCARVSSQSSCTCLTEHAPSPWSRGRTC
jgi:hypothetical protein